MVVARLLQPPGRSDAGPEIALHDTYYAVGQFHYTLSLGTVFAIFAGFYYWLPKMTGRMYPEGLAKFQFWITFIGVNLTFIPMHFAGLEGMKRGLPTYPDAYWGWTMVSSIGAYTTVLGGIVFLYLLWRTFAAGRRIGENPWGEGATTREWTVGSPPPFHAHEEIRMAR